MTNLKVKTTSHYKKPRLIQKMSLGLLVVGGILILYTGYCWGWWGRNSLLLQYLFQCGCPLSSNESRYPKRVDVIIPACQHDSIMLSPSGRLLYVNKYILWDNFGYFLDVKTGEKTQYKLPEGENYFLTDNLIFYLYDGSVFDRRNEIQYPIKRFENWHSESYLNGTINLNLLSIALQNAKQIFLVSNDAVVVIFNDFITEPEGNFFIRRSSFLGSDANRLEKFLEENNIEFIFIAERYSHLSQSPNAKFIARDDGIYLSATNQKIVEGFSPAGEYRPASGEYFWVVGWTHDNRGVIYSKREEVCLIEMNFFVRDICIFKVSQPVLLLKVPQEYLDAPMP